jgi:two-component system, chemotaxis family, CheB/CheR fusion protein
LSEGETEGRLIYELASRQWDIPQLRTMLTDVATRDAQVQGFELTYQFPGVGEKVLSLNARRVVRQQEAILLAIEDITEHRQSQQLLEEREAWFHQIADNAPALIWVTSPDGRYTFINKVWLDYTGRSQANVLANGWVSAIHPDDRAVYEQTYQTHFSARQPFQIEYRLRRHDGQYHWMLENAQSTVASDGQFTGFIGTAADVQEQKELTIRLDQLVSERTQEVTQTNQRLQKTAEALQAVLDNSPASIGLLEVIQSPSGTITDFQVVVANQRFAQLMNQPLDELYHMKASQLSSRLWDQHTLSQLSHVVETGKPLYMEQPHPTSGWLALSVTKQDGGVVITGLDITDLRQTQEQREDLLNQVRQSGETVEQLTALQQQVRLRGELLRTSSHDLRGSLGVIQGAADLLVFADSGEERAQMLDMVQRNVQETTRLVNELLDFSRLEAGQHQTQLTHFDAAELLKKLGENIRPLLTGKGLKLRLLGKAHMPVEGDALNVLRIAQNVVLNALKYTAEGSIAIRWDYAGPDEWYFSIKDTGRGMDAAVANTLSQPATAPVANAGPANVTDADSLLTDEPLLGASPGEGIGLIIVRQLCSLLRGRLLVESQPSQGSTFRVVLPRRY